MLAEQRRSRILHEVAHRGAARVTDLAVLLDVSEMTIRRDLDVLADRDALDKVHGGATARRAPSTDEPGFAAKSVRQQAEKEAIAQAAAALVSPGAAIAISAGTTTWTFARRLSAVPNLTVVTNSIQIADVFHASPSPDTSVVLTGGVRTPSDALVGPVAVSALRQLHVDLVFLGVHGMDPGAGFTTPNILEAETNRAMVSAAQRLVVLADHTKWRTVGLSTIAGLDQADVLVSDDALPHDARKTLGDEVAELVLAPGPAVALPPDTHPVNAKPAHAIDAIQGDS
ncbi:DeoR/GlpR transcriptional regulator [Phytoactinopolyspora alkaliphila]|uniref:DeoR/GlpR transcriptional regulator n=1 Tax=Phytoactinopolyspora alkaliphila TaxID=1783498 RepID=A0A6N9YJD4_9ACTN|nr:DeoR/GlpR family DNA-binding transcription regulator [Phytoactinopolyspora alkaliphila]NED95045.1 DeoR/GlpR transcriptional regulator [Phytoactinopolyspora alkaliphila]